MTFAGIAFLNPWLLTALAALPVIYLLLRAVPPRPATVEFPPTRILVGLENEEKTADKTPWWLTLIRMLAAALVIFALADPVLNPERGGTLKGNGPVIIVADNGWASAAHWQGRERMIDRLINDAEAANRSVMVVPTASTTKATLPKVEAPTDARNTAAALKPQPFAPDRKEAVAALENAIGVAKIEGPSIVWLHDGIDYGDTVTIASDLQKIAGTGSLTIADISHTDAPIGLTARLGEKGKLEAMIFSPLGIKREGVAVALSARGERLGEARYDLGLGAQKTETAFDLPLELRNQVARIELPSERSAGAVSLIDAATQWHRVGLLSSESREEAQPLLAPLYYIQKALKPYAELAISHDSNIVSGINSVLTKHISVLMLADIGTLSGEAAKQVEDFVDRGGVLVRFAGPRLEKAGDSLLPVQLRAGGRSLGGALSWSTPQPLAPFDEASPFAGLTLPQEVLVNRQVLADPARLTPEVEIWARLKDGTPLVTAAKRGNGKLVLFHITANADWSNLPISGLFVEMLRRISTMGVIGAASGEESTANGSAVADTQNLLPPIRTLTGDGALKAPPPTAEPIKASDLATAMPTREHPPGYYGNSGAPRALNVLTPKSELLPFPALPSSVAHMAYDNVSAMPLKPWILGSALLLLFADIIAVLILQAGGLGGRFRTRTAPTAAALILLCVSSFAITPNDVRADPAPGTPQPAKMPKSYVTDQVAIAATSKVTFGYILSGDRATDEVSRAGLDGLARVLQARTAVEPGEPAGIDITKDEIAFFPILYWPVLENAQPLADAIVAKIDAYMKDGGLIVFDTRDYGQGGINTLPLAGKGGTALQRLLNKLDVPPLQPVPENHVVTKSFYLLRSFPGRWDGGQLWVEATSQNPNDTHRARVSDGVTSIMVTSNDFAAAWALDETGRPLYPVVPGGESQREMAFRSGINIVMHALTGNYKADQVHVPALLERLGQ